jgi:hypothetical protein
MTTVLVLVGVIGVAVLLLVVTLALERVRPSERDGGPDWESASADGGGGEGGGV